MKTLKQLFITSALKILAIGALAGCGSDSSSTSDDLQAASQADDTRGATQTALGGAAGPAGITTLQIDATAGGLGAPTGRYTYVNLDTGAVLNLTEAEAAASTDWHIGFQRTRTKLNGGVSGPGTVTGALADAQDDFYDAGGNPDNSVFLNATAASELPSLQEVTDVSALTFSSDRHIPAITSDGGSDSWWAYNPMTHATSAAPDNWWLVKSAAGNSYAKLHATGLIRGATRDITLELFVQGVGQSSFSSTAIFPTLNIPLSGGAICYDFDAATVLGCTTTDWDIKVEYTNRSYNIWTNGGTSGSGAGAAFGTVAAADIGDYPSGTLHTNGRNISSLYKSDSAGGLFVDNSWYAYGLQGNSKLWPNYRVYAIDSGSAEYALQILSYYDLADTSGHITFRYKEL